MPSLQSFALLATAHGGGGGGAPFATQRTLLFWGFFATVISSLSIFCRINSLTRPIACRFSPGQACR
ncbi:hypothetical protein N658DRAFT_490605 [Parathielavia hyrcaniae]|uniref:Uncharacterized protein n=1 Tax=Parathielavia hyrcaniae TaxID=113614 RepID=A0AAN6Q9E0_9PEZI|nr:hypothetical protein N658DRAFT_490605 [Parathielavia hyrcaniae]